MSARPQKELVSGETWYETGEEIPNVRKKLFALRNQCTECNVCEVACSLVHSPAGEINPQLSRIRIDRAPGEPSKVNESGLGFVAEICHHCGNPPPCADVCPTTAFYYDPETRAAVIDQDRCIRCMECVPACPFDVIFVAPDGELLKCDLCAGDPVCVKVCSTRPELLNPGKRYNRVPVLFYERQADFNRAAREKPVARDELGMMQAMLERGEISTGA
ncbi:MAG TPA: 4Fe-4S dicluster domain-containing protein [Gammaproteobacteria bacterium]|jgi:Fe-S-cluster-containing hydrogenase component 2|nr:4Fe-4S dicluster domain-containing protein [Gammaproteobacteria bacterium]